MKIENYKPGFTLLELLAVVGILGFVLIAVTQLLGSTLAGSGKTNSLQLVKQNGQFALSTMSRLLRLAKSVDICTNNDLQFTVSEAGTDVIYRFNLSGTRLQKTRDGQVSWVTDDPVSTNIRVNSFTCSLTTSSAGNPAVVDLQITIEKLGLSVENSVVNTTFNTSVSLRTY